MVVVGGVMQSKGMIGMIITASLRSVQLFETTSTSLRLALHVGFTLYLSLSLSLCRNLYGRLYQQKSVIETEKEHWRGNELSASEHLH